MDWQQTVLEPVNAMWIRVLGFLPTLVSVIIILIAGLFLASMIQRLVTRFLKLTPALKAGYLLASISMG